jgi:hypothetical protein
VPVFFKFKVGSKTEIDSIGFSRMYRYPYAHKVSEFAVQDVVGAKPNGTLHGYDLCDIVWGTLDDIKKRKVETSIPLKGRVSVGHAFAEGYFMKNEDACRKGVLGQPKPTFFPFYVDQTQQKDGFNTYDTDGGKLSGRKVYPIHLGAVVELPTGSDKNEKVVTRFRPAPQGLTFTCRIVVHNLREVEIGAVLSALTLHGNEGQCFHNMGLAKGYGFGQLRVVVRKLKGLRFNKEHYLAAFEERMNRFVTENKIANRWVDTLQVQTIVGCHKENPISDLKAMELKAFKDLSLSKNAKIVRLSDLSDKNVSTRLSKEYLQEKVRQIEDQKRREEEERGRRCKEVAEKVDSLLGELEEESRGNADYGKLENLYDELKEQSSSKYYVGNSDEVRSRMKVVVDSLISSIEDGFKRANNIDELNHVERNCDNAVAFVLRVGAVDDRLDKVKSQILERRKSMASAQKGLWERIGRQKEVKYVSQRVEQYLKANKKSISKESLTEEEVEMVKKRIEELRQAAEDKKSFEEQVVKHMKRWL